MQDPTHPSAGSSRPLRNSNAVLARIETLEGCDQTVLEAGGVGGGHGLVLGGPLPGPA